MSVECGVPFSRALAASCVDANASPIICSVSKSGEWAWAACGSLLEVLDNVNGFSISLTDFAADKRISGKISHVVEIPHSTKWGSSLVVCLKTGSNSSALIVFDPSNSTVSSASTFSHSISSVETTPSGIPISFPVKRAFTSQVTVGTTRGKVFLLDLFSGAAPHSRALASECIFELGNGQFPPPRVTNFRNCSSGGGGHVCKVAHSGATLQACNWLFFGKLSSFAQLSRRIVRHYSFKCALL
jgi:hypothetical protein